MHQASASCSEHSRVSTHDSDRSVLGLPVAARESHRRIARRWVCRRRLHRSIPDLGHHGRQSRAVARDLGRLHGGNRLQPALGRGCVLVGLAESRTHVLQHQDRRHDPGARCAGAARRLRRDARCGVMQRHHPHRGGTINGFNNTLINIGGTETAGYDLNVRWAMPETSIGQIYPELAEHLARRVHRVHGDRRGIRGDGTQRNGARQPVAGISGMEVRAVCLTGDLHDFGSHRRHGSLHRLAQPNRAANIWSVRVSVLGPGGADQRDGCHDLRRSAGLLVAIGLGGAGRSQSVSITCSMKIRRTATAAS